MKTLFKQVSGCLVAVLILTGLVFIALLFLRGGVWLGAKVLPWLVWVATLTLAVVLLVLLPLATSWRTRPFAGKGMIYASSILGMTLWIWGLLLTYNLWGGGAVLIGLFLFGVGVVPMAMLATLFQAMWPTLGQLILLAVLTGGTRHFGTRLLAKVQAAEHKIYELEIVDQSPTPNKERGLEP